MNRKAFTLIELLVVVAIIGILAAVGVVAYNGYTASAKASTTKANFKMMQRYMSAEVAKCDLGETSIMKRDNGSSINCSGITYGKIIPHLQQLFNTDKNPYSTSNNAVVSSGSFVAGQVSVSASGTNVLVKTCTKTGCATGDQMSATISID